MNIVFFHGTLQRSSVWEEFINYLKEASHEISFFTPDFYSDNPDNLDTWYKNILNELPKTSKSIFIGYSLGGRFALELYKRTESANVGGLVLIAMDPGIESDAERIQTLKRDEIWAEKFLDKDWIQLMEEWNNLPVFAGQLPTTIQKEENFSRETLAKLWLLSSKGNNPNLWPELPNIKCPVLLVSGALDQKFNNISVKMEELISNVQHEVFENCGHRVPWENPTRFKELLSNFITSKCKN